MPAAQPRWLFVFSHPNHEIAVFGHMQRLRPHLVFLTDGGGPQRVAESRRGLEHLGLAEHAQFLGHPEQSLYAALLARDVGFWQGLASEIARVVERVRPDCVAADAVEFYNPVHDMSLPLAEAALAESARPAALYEVPLIFEKARGASGDYAVQTPLAAGGEAIELSADEWAKKIGCWRTIYGQLRAQLGTVIDAIGDGSLAREVLHPARDALRQPAAEERLRYEERGRKLQERGEVAEVITLHGHVRPVVQALLGGRARR
ncbi:MAG TPA: hypothetical protein VJL84_02605 [Kiloniellales bacterium]|nr:hypothetical protein [Kiloniellales bacterium]